MSISHDVFNSMLGMQIIESTMIPLETFIHEIVDVRFSHSASHREWKRLVRERRKLAKPKTRRNAIVFDGKIIMHPDDARALREATSDQLPQKSPPRIRPYKRIVSDVLIEWPFLSPYKSGSIFRTDIA